MLFVSLSHSLILNVQDSCWQEYFSPSEIEEIADYRSVDLPPAPELDIYLDGLKSLSPERLYTKLVSEELPIQSTNKWIQDSFYQSIRLFKSGFFPINNVTEGGLVKRIWSCVDACFDFSAITCTRLVGMMMAEVFLTSFLVAKNSANRLQTL